MSAALGALGALVVAAGCTALAPYLARLTRSVPDRSNRRWWRGERAEPPRVAAVVLVGVLFGGLAGAAAGWSALLPAFAALAVAATPLSVVDWEHHRLPDRLVVPAAIAGALLLTLAAGARSDWSALARAGAAAVAVLAVLLTLNLGSPRGFGVGDVKVGALLGGYLGWFGWAYVFWGLFAGFVLGAAVALTLVAARRATMSSPVAFGPMLVLGALAVLAVPRLHPSG